jgi:uncharacterized protein YbbK (DUF523 family)
VVLSGWIQEYKFGGPKKFNMKVLVSACLTGCNCKYNGGNNYNQRVADYLKDKEVIEICPEMLAGLGAPRSPAEIADGVVITRDGKNPDKEFREGVTRALEKSAART